MMTDEHLGGFVEGGDDATYFPDLWRWLVEGPLEVRTVLDVGCGEGHAVRFFQELGIEASGIDGVIESDDPYIRKHDFVDGDVAWWPVDLVWSCEFVEHVEERYARNFMPSFRAGKLVLMTHAFPGQAGHHHVNCREPEYWKGFMTAGGLRFSEGLTSKTREFAAKNTDPYNHFSRSGLAFRK